MIENEGERERARENQRECGEAIKLGGKVRGDCVGKQILVLTEKSYYIIMGWKLQQFYRVCY